MAPPSPDLQKKIDNSKKVLEEGKNLDDYHELRPDKYLDSISMDIFEKVKPWELKIDIKKKSEKYQTSYMPEKMVVQETFYAPTSPTPKILVICVDFSDKPSTLSLSAISDRFNLKTPEAKSLYKYFNDISLGNHVPDFRVYGWYRMPKTRSYYANNESGGGYKGITELTTDAVNLALGDDIISWCLFDNDKNNTVDYIVIITSGNSAETTSSLNDLWSYAYGMSTINIPKLCNGVYMTSNIFIRCSEHSNGFNPIGVYCHEYAHMLGAHDMYDYNSKTVGAGEWSLMGTGSYLDGGNTPCNIDAYNRERIGFVIPVINSIDTNLIRDSLSTTKIYKYTTEIQNEYFLLENRQQISWDRYLPGNGILIWHVSTECKVNSISTYNAYLMQSDGRNDLGESKNNHGDYGDPYPNIEINNRSFTKTSNPNNLLCGSTSAYLKYDITYISNSSNEMVFYTILNAVPCAQPTCSFTIILGTNYEHFYNIK